MRGRGRGYHKTFTLQVRKDDDEDIARSGHKKIFVHCKQVPSLLTQELGEKTFIQVRCRMK